MLTNKGEPLRVPFACQEEDLQAVGVACTQDDPCPIYFEISSIVPDGRKIFLAGNLHSTSATLNSILLMSEDEGTNWKEPATRIRGSALDQMQFYSLQDGWAAGETQYPLPRDPFFLITSDGGSSWRQAAVGEDGMPGSIQRFWFDSAQHGELIIDAGKGADGGRYFTYETETGGGSWTLRAKSDAAPRLRRAPLTTDNPDLRVRPSRDGKTYSIEQRTGDKWNAVASFLIEVADCRGSDAELKEPQPDVPPPPPPPAPVTRPARRK